MRVDGENYVDEASIPYSFLCVFVTHTRKKIAEIGLLHPILTPGKYILYTMVMHTSPRL
jgi:hypothetical protein